MARILAAVDPNAAREFVGGVSPSHITNLVNEKQAEELEISSIVSKGSSVLLGPYVR